MSNDMIRRSVLKKGAVTTLAGGLILGSQSVSATSASDYELRVERVGTGTARYGIGINKGSGDAYMSLEDIDSNAEFRTNSDYTRVLWATEAEEGDVDICKFENCEDPVIERGEDAIAVFQDDERIH